MKHAERPGFDSEEKIHSAEETEKEKRARLMVRYITERIVGKNASADKIAEEEIAEYYKDRTPREKAEILYEKIVAYNLDRQIAAEQRRKDPEFILEDPDPEFISEIKVLAEDHDTKKIFSETYAEARIDAKVYRVSQLGNRWNELNTGINKIGEEFRDLEKKIFLKQIQGATNNSHAKSKQARLAKRIIRLMNEKKQLANLDGLPKIKENTDAVAMFQYGKYKEYKEQGERGFVWLASRKKIHQETINALQNTRWPLLIGEAGTGKSQQADAAAIELTGYPPTEIECGQNTSELDLIKDIAIDPETGGSYEKYGPLMQAFTGYEDSRQKNPSYTTGRVTRFDESGRLGPKAYAVIKKARQKRSGDDFYGRTMLNGASAIWTTNPVGPRYQGRYQLDPAMRREVAKIYVDYPEQNEEYDFMVSQLLEGIDSHPVIFVSEDEVAPAYERKEIPEAEQETLPDGNIIVATSELIADQTDQRHGTLWRLSCAMKALHNGFIAGNAENIADTLRFSRDADGKIEIVANGDEPLTLSSSTITLGEMASWMRGFGNRLQKQDESFHVDSFSEWIRFKIETYLKQVDEMDREKIHAIFDHFHLLEVSPKSSQLKPMTPQRIGYLSVDVPRPVYVVKSKIVENVSETPQEPLKTEVYETIEVMLENGENVLIMTGEYTGSTVMSEQFAISGKEKFLVNHKNFTFVGVVSDASSENNGMLVGAFLDEPQLHQLFSAEEVEEGMMRWKLHELEEFIAYQEKQFSTQK